VFALTHNYTGYPLVKQARAMVQNGDIGDLRKVVAEYPQGWLSDAIEDEGQKQASWRTDPELAGAGALGDIGTHAENLVGYVTGLQMERLLADVGTVVDGRAVDDDVNMLVRYEGGVRGVLYCSQIAQGEENNLRLRVYGTTGSLDWRQEDPHRLVVRRNGEPQQIYTHGSDYLSEAALHNTRLPAGHPEAFIEAFANVYRNAGRTIAARLAGETPDPLDLDFPTVHDGAVGVHFIQMALESGRQDAWIDASYTPPGGTSE
jgi:predicted dehydrogenase